MEDYKDYEMIKGGQGKETENLNRLRETFINQYCNSKGWDSTNLSPEQLNEIKSQKEYLNPGMILG